MFELSGAAALLQTIGWLYVVIALAALALALYLPKKWWLKVSLGTAVFAAFVGYPATKVLEAKVEKDERAAVFQAKLAKAQALFAERCKTAGEKIYRTVEGVEGVLLMNIRPEVNNFSDQFPLTDPYGHDFGGDAYIASFLWGRNNDGKTWEGDTRGGFRFVDAIDVVTQIRHRYTATVRHLNNPGNSHEFLISKNLTIEDRPRYGVMWYDLSTSEDRKLWIAGGSIKIIDLKTNEVIGERKGYMMDAGQGNISGGRSPWLFAQQNACPEFPTIGGADSRRRRSSQINRNFVESILKPKQGE